MSATSTHVTCARPHGPRTVRRLRLSLLGGLLATLPLSLAALPVTPAVVAGLGMSAAVADTAPAAGTPTTVSADALPTVQINGVVWAQVTVGNTVYATGQFTQARPAGVAVGGAGSVTRSNLVAYDITTGNLVTSFNHALNGAGRAITASPDGSRVYVGGAFTTVDKVTHNHIAAFDTATGALVAGFSANLNATVYDIAATNATVYAGGDFTTANASSRARLAAYSSAGVLSAWNPGANDRVSALTMTPDGSRVVAGGRFTTLAGAAAVGMGAVDAATGASQPWAANNVIKNSGANAEIGSLTSDGSRVYGTGWSYTGGGNFEGRFAADPATGQIQWMNPCHGDSYSAAVIGSLLYSTGHEHDCSDIGAFSQDAVAVFSSTHHYSAVEQLVPAGKVARHPIYPCCPNYFDFAGQPVGSQLDWYPTYTQGTATGQSQAAWSVSGNAQYVSVGGEFPRVNGAAQQGLVRFAVTSTAPNKVGPQASTGLTPTVRSQTAGTARVAWQTTWDQDNTSLTYRLYRDGGTSPIYTTTADSLFSRLPSLGYLDTGLDPGSSHSYQVRVSDPFGNSVTSGSTSVTVGSSTVDDYTAAVTGDGATGFWPLAESSGSTFADRAGYSDAAFSGTVTLGADGPVTGQRAARFGGGEKTTQNPQGPPTSTPNNSAGTVSTVDPGGPFSVEAWVKTTSSQGGAIVSAGLFGAGNSQAVDKALYMTTSGQLRFGVQDNTAVSTIASPSSYNDGQWHHVVGTYASGTGRLYVDGTEAASGAMNDDIIFPAHWRFGGDNLTGWTEAPATSYLAATLGDVAVYPTELSASQVANHLSVAGGGGVVNQPPVADFTPSCTERTCTVDGSASHDTDGGTLSTYEWTFGDGGTATGATPPAHVYAADGAYPITLKVTDDGGASGTVSHSVTVAGGVTPPPPPPPPTTTTYADDVWNRTVASGFGTAAPSGGAWSTSGSTLSVAPGQGRITLAAGKRAQGWLGSLSQTAYDVRTSFSLDKLPVTGSGYYFYVAGRRVSATSQYAVLVKVSPAGAVSTSLVKFAGSTSETSISPSVAAGTVAAGGAVNVRMQVTGTSPTTLRYRSWNGAAAEPTTWAANITDSSAGIQAAGAPGVQGYLSGSTTNGPVTARIGELVVQAP